MNRLLSMRICLLVMLLISSLGTSSFAQEQSTDYVPKEAFAAMILNVDAFKKTSDAEYFPHEIISAIGKVNYGFDPSEIESVKMIVGINDEFPPSTPTMGVILGLKKAQQIAGKLSEDSSPTVVDGTEIYFDRNTEMHVVQADPKTILFATTEPFALVMAASKNVKNPFTKLLAKSSSDRMIHMVLSVEKLKPLMDQLIDQFPAPAPFGAVNKLHTQLKDIQLETNMLGGVDMKIEMTAYSDKDARNAEKTIKQLLTIAKASALTFMATQVDQDDIIQQAQYDYTARIADKFEKELTPTRKDDKLTIEFKNDVANVGVLVALLLPAVQAAREAARRTQASNEIKQMGLSFHNYHDTQGSFPAQAITGKGGKKLLSWRVQVLPYLGYGDLYDEFHLDEPWDSDHNKKLLKRMPDVFRSPNIADPEMTNFLAVTGKGTAFDGPKGKKISDFKDGLSKTILFVEADKMVPWTKPEDLEVDWNEPLRDLGNIRPGIFVAGFADGSVQAISETVDYEVLINMFRISDGK